MSNLPTPVKVIALLTSIGGLSITAGSLTDIIQPFAYFSLSFHLLRLVVGVSMLAISYALIKRQRWGVWLYGVIVLISFFVNPPLSLLPLAIVFYLYTQRGWLNPSIIDAGAGRLLAKFKEGMYKQ
jgi:hypothetical protein